MQGQIIINTLVKQGVTTFVISPGSRSTPLTLAVARHPEAHSVIAYDERAAAYHAVGYARATSRPAALICTSGTAAANYLPAITEASNDAIPLIALTADRPPERHGIGANQTMDQQNLYGGFVRHFVNITPDTATSPLPNIVANAVERSLSPLPGPVHLNCMFREPFSTTPCPPCEPLTPPPKEACGGHDAAGDAQANNHATWQAALRAEAPPQRAMVIVGHLATDDEREAVTQLLEQLAWPTWADIRSGLHNRNGFMRDRCAITALLSDPTPAPTAMPDFVLHLGGNVVDKTLLTFLSDTYTGAYVKAAGRRQQVDPSGRCTHTLAGDLTAVCHMLSDSAAALRSTGLTLTQPSAYEDLLARLEDEASPERPLSEPAIGYLLSQSLSDDMGLVLGNSMPVRFCDRFAMAEHLPSRVIANRGVSGIDGTIATAVGFSRGLDAPVVCLLGDLTFLHDMNSLTQLTTAPHPILFVVVNNQGGGIFHHLPIAEQTDVFEPFFVTPHTYRFEAIATQFDMAYSRATTHGDLTQALATALDRKAHTVMELTVDQHTNMEAYRRCSI